MKNLAKLSVLGIFALFCFAWMVNGLASAPGYRVRAQAQPTPPANANTGNAAIPANTTTNANANGSAAVNANTTAGNTVSNAGKSIPKNFVLGKDSLSEEGEAAFDHETHSTGLYSPDGKATIGCVVCHHTDQPKSALKLPLVTSERDVALTLESWKASSQKVNNCRSCHFQAGGDIPDGKTMPVVGEKEYNNKEAYHKNCNECHDAAAKERPDLKKKPGFATGIDCLICHKKN
jgi:hypothetical protein